MISMRRRVWLAPAVGGTLLLVAAALRLGGDLPTEQLVSDVLPNVVLGLGLPALGAAVLTRLPGHRLGQLWVFCGLAAALTLAVHSYAEVASRQQNWPLLLLSAWAASWLWVLGTTPFLTLGLLLFPDGRLPSRRWRPAVALAGGAVALPVLGQALKPGELEGLGVDNPLGVTALAEVTTVLGSLGFLCFLLGVGVGAASLVVRWRSGEAGVRSRLTLPAVAAALLATTFLIPTTAALSAWLDAAAVVEVALLLGSLGVALLREHLPGGQPLLRRSLTYGLLIGLLVTTFAGVVAVASLALPDQTSDLVASVVTVLLALPVHTRLRGIVDRALYGERSDPFAALDRFDQRIDSADDPQEVLQGVAESVATILRLPSVRVLVQRPDGEVTAASVGPAVDRWIRLPLQHRGQGVGALLVTPRAGQEQLDPRDVRMLETLQRQAAAAVAAVRMGVELQESRQRLIAAREEERRRVRRDLHDGLGPTLAGIGLGLEVSKASTDPDEVQRLLQSLKEEAAAAVLDVRRLVDDLRPPALDELGLVGALRRHADRLNAGDVRVEVRATSTLSGLPAAVEVAAYRIAMEAMTNAVRHGRPRHCALELRVDDALHLEVCDDGAGLPASLTAGVGLSSMRERAAELGGTCSVRPRGGGGTTVAATIPLQVR